MGGNRRQRAARRKVGGRGKEKKYEKDESKGEKVGKRV